MPARKQPARKQPARKQPVRKEPAVKQLDYMPLYKRLLPWTLITELYWLSYKLLERRLFPTGVSVSQARVLGLLYFSNKPVKPSRLATLLFQETQSITGILHRIETKGWVRRQPDPEDRRAVGLELTDKGRDLAKRVVAISEDLYGEVFQERGGLERILRKLRAHGLILPETDAKLRRAGFYDLWKA
jgi:DNA-binding MarR family transcriptional regulator